MIYPVLKAGWESSENSNVEEGRPQGASFLDESSRYVTDLKSAFTLNLAEEAVRFTINTSGEEELIGLACHISIAK